MDLPEQIQHQIERVNRLLATQRTLPDKLEAIAEVIERTVPRCDAVSIALVVHGEIVTAAASSRVALEADLIQYGFNQGPCLTAAAEDAVVRIDVLQEEEQFEHFAPGAIRLGVSATLSIPLRARDEVVGSINVYSFEPNAFDEQVAERLAPIADYAGQVIAHSPLHAASLGLVEELVAVVSDRDLVNLAVGLLMGGGALGESEAWEELRQRALDRSISIIEAARAVHEDHRPAAGPDALDGDPGRDS